MRKPIRHAYQFLQGSDPIAALLAGIERNATLLRAIRRALPPPLDAHCLHAALERGALTLVADSPVWSSRLRFFVPELERALSTRYGSIDSCRIRIQPVAQPTAPGSSSQSRRRLSAKTVKHLLETAADMEDPDIATVLRRLANCGKQAS